MYSVIIVKVYRLKLQRQTPSQKNINVNFRPLVSSDGYYYREILSVAYFFFLFDPLFPPQPLLHHHRSCVYYSSNADATTAIYSITTVSSIRLSCTILSWPKFRWTRLWKTLNNKHIFSSFDAKCLFLFGLVFAVQQNPIAFSAVSNSDSLHYAFALLQFLSCIVFLRNKPASDSQIVTITPSRTM